MDGSKPASWVRRDFHHVYLRAPSSDKPALRVRDVDLSEEAAHHLMDDPELREPLGLCAYGHDLLGRLEGRAIGPAALVLWRSFAWTPQGSPKKRFTLTARAITEGETGAAGCLPAWGGGLGHALAPIVTLTAPRRSSILGARGSLDDETP